MSTDNQILVHINHIPFINFPRQLTDLDLAIYDIRNISGGENIIADTLSRVETVAFQISRIGNFIEIKYIKNLIVFSSRLK